jgi:hypothetical protein
VNFAYHLNPNFRSEMTLNVNSALANISWPRWNSDTWTNSDHLLLTLEDPKNLTISGDNYRVEAMDSLSALQGELGL